MYKEIFETIYGYPLSELNEERASVIRKDILELRESFNVNIPERHYNKENYRKAYMLCYYANYFQMDYELIINLIDDGIINLKNKKLEVVFWAAGSGPEIYGTLKAINDLIDNKLRVRLNILDYEDGWRKERKLTYNLLQKLPKISITGGKINVVSGCDLTLNCKEECTNWKNCEDAIYDSDLFFMQFCINHISFDKNFKEEILKKVKLMKKEALFIIVELDYKRSIEVLRALNVSKEIEVVKTNINLGIKISEINIKMDKKMREMIFNPMYGKLNGKKRTNYYYFVFKRRENKSGK